MTVNSPAVFWSRVRKDDSGCWLWTRACYANGYGRFVAAGERWAAHRYAYALVKGPIPEGLTLDHLCRVRHCVNPTHLEPVTIGENVLRGIGPTAQHARQTHCVHGHEFTPENLLVTKRRRICRTCRRAYRRAYRIRRKAQVAA